MRSSVLSLILALTASCQFSSAATLTGATFFGAEASGITTIEVWNTLGNDLLFNLYVLEGSTAINTGNGSNAGINIPLNTAGVFTFIFRAQPGLLSHGQFGLNLFFNGNGATPGISALVSGNSSTFVVNNGVLTPSLTGLPLVAAANSLVFADSVSRVTLTGLSQARSGGNQVSAYANTPGLAGGNDYVGSFTLSVATPEPSTYLMLGSALACIGLLRRKAV